MTTEIRRLGNRIEVLRREICPTPMEKLFKKHYQETAALLIEKLYNINKISHTAPIVGWREFNRMDT